MSEADQIVDRARAVLQKKPIDGYEIYLSQVSHFYVDSKEGKVDTFQASHSYGMALRVLNHHRMGFSYTTPSAASTLADLDDGLEQAIGNAMASAEVTSADPCFDFSPPLETPPSSPPIFDERVSDISERAKIERARRLEEAARSVDPERIKKVRKASYQEALFRKMLVNSNGFRFTYAATLISVSVTAVAEEAGESEVGWEFDYSRFFSDLDVEKVGRSAGKKALERLGGKRIPSGTYPVLLRNHVASEFLGLLAHSFLSDQVQKGKSFLKEKRGERIFSSLFSCMDDGLLPGGISTSPIDGEGTPSQRTVLVRQGEISGYLYDRYWANREKGSSTDGEARSTGNSRRSGIKAPPGIGVSNFFIEPGRLTSAGLMKELHQGLILEDVMGLHTVDPISGDFSLGCSGDWVERGEKVHPVKSIAVAGNLFELFRKVVGVGEDLRFFGGVGSPSLLIDEIEVSGN